MIKPLLLMSVAVMLTGCDDFAFGPGLADFSAELCGDYYLHRNSAHQIQVSFMGWNDSAPIIPAKVVKLGHDERFIIAKQNHLKRRSPGNPKDTYMEPDPGVFSYWILDVSVPEAHGPFTEDEFHSKRKELGVADAMKMKGVYSYRK